MTNCSAPRRGEGRAGRLSPPCPRRADWRGTSVGNPRSRAARSQRSNPARSGRGPADLRPPVEFVTVILRGSAFSTPGIRRSGPRRRRGSALAGSRDRPSRVPWPGSPRVIAGCVAAPGSAGLADEPGGVVVGVAEHAGDHGCRCLEHEVPQRCGAAGDRGDSVPAEVFLERVRGHGLGAAAAGEQPWGLGVGGGGQVGAVAQVAQQQLGERGRDRCRWVAEPDRDLPVVLGDVVETQPLSTIT